MQNIMFNVIFYGSFALILIGILIVFTQKNIIKILLGLNIADTGVNILIVSTGFIKNGQAPILSGNFADLIKMVDPVPQALVLTSIVIGFGVTAVGLSLAVRLYQKYKTLDVSKIRGLKW